MSNVLSISTLTPKVSAWPSTFHTGRMNAVGKKGTFIFYCGGLSRRLPFPVHTHLDVVVCMRTFQEAQSFGNMAKATGWPCVDVQ